MIRDLIQLEQNTTLSKLQNVQLAIVTKSL